MKLDILLTNPTNHKLNFIRYLYPLSSATTRLSMTTLSLYYHHYHMDQETEHLRRITTEGLEEQDETRGDVITIFYTKTTTTTK